MGVGSVGGVGGVWVGGCKVETWWVGSGSQPITETGGARSQDTSALTHFPGDATKDTPKRQKLPGPFLARSW